MNKHKLIFSAVWVLLMSLAPITVLNVTTLSEATEYPVTLTNFFQRLVGLWAYTLLFIQLILGAFMPKLTEKFGGWIYSFHVFQGVFLYGFILAHPLLFVLFKYYAGSGFDPFYVFTQLCVLCQNKAEFFYTFGRAAFWIFTLTIAAGFFRTFNPYLRKHWRKFHIFNYLAFIFIGIHSLEIGSDIGTAPFSFFHGPALFVVSFITASKIYYYFKPKKKEVLGTSKKIKKSPR